MLGGSGSVFRAPWPTFDAEAAKFDELEIPVQVNGKLRGKFVVPAEAGEDDYRAKALDAVKAQLDGKAPRKVIVVKGRLVNIVV